MYFSFIWILCVSGLEGNDELNVLHYPDEFCSKCEKQAEEAKKEIEDLQAQVNFVSLNDDL